MEKQRTIVYQRRGKKEFFEWPASGRAERERISGFLKEDGELLYAVEETPVPADVQREIRRVLQEAQALRDSEYLAMRQAAGQRSAVR